MTSKENHNDQVVEEEVWGEDVPYHCGGARGVQAPERQGQDGGGQEDHPEESQQQ